MKLEGNVLVDKPKKVKVSPSDLSSIKQAAHTNYVNTANAGLEGERFTTKCYLDAVVGFLNRNGVSFVVDYEHLKRQLDTVGDED